MSEPNNSVDEFIHEIQSLLLGEYGGRCDRIAIHVEHCWTASRMETELDFVHVIYHVDGAQQSLISHGREQTLIELREKIAPTYDPIYLGGHVTLMQV